MDAEGPIPHGTAEELERIEREYERPGAVGTTTPAQWAASRVEGAGKPRPRLAVTAPA
jgi:hypothetical protein